MAVLLSCLHCGFNCKGLTLHLKYKHSQTPAEYRMQFPGAEIFSSSVRKQMSQNNHLIKTSMSFNERFGQEEADRIKKKIGKESGASRKGKKRPQQGETIKATWEKKRESWSLSIRTHAQTELSREKHRVAMKKRIAENGYHLARGKETKLEKFVRETLETSGLYVVKQKGTLKATLGTTRFFDLWVPELNLVVECDGEYWHASLDRITIDTKKNEAAKIEGYTLLRVSDTEFSKKFNKIDEAKLLSLLELSDHELELRATEMVQDRLIKLNPKSFM